jgi:hypothetical protein
MKKTPLQQLIENLHATKLRFSTQGQIAMMNKAIGEAERLLPQERDMVEAAHYEGGYSTNGSTSEAKKYFNETFEQ